jgi:hypothetical protein
MAARCNEILVFHVPNHVGRRVKLAHFFIGHLLPVTSFSEYKMPATAWGPV